MPRMILSLLRRRPCSQAPWGGAVDCPGPEQEVLSQKRCPISSCMGVSRVRRDRWPVNSHDGRAALRRADCGGGAWQGNGNDILFALPKSGRKTANLSAKVTTA